MEKAATGQIAVLGSGSWGTALAILLARQGSRVRLWGLEAQDILQAGENSRYLPGVPLPETLEVCVDLDQALLDLDTVLLAVPSVAFAQVLAQVHNHGGVRRVAWATKGLDHDHNQLLSDLVRQIWPDLRAMAVLSGPTFAMEVAKGLPSALNVASSDEAFAAYLCGCLNGPNFHAYPIADMIGVQVCGAVKNVIAIAAGIVGGMGYGANTRCALITRGLAEMNALGVAMGADEATFADLAGIGDLMLTATDDQSRNRRFGLALGRGALLDEAESAIGQVVEGRSTALRIDALCQDLGVSMPIVATLLRLFSGEITIADLESLWFV
jgi:glycerol-3-phosphate dehydrogenase (NAD(P)+)